ncbi:hypothetical protein BPORC_1854 [Bifidobacterium porcinum]|nr:hypothetical protein BPORC_1854 [Bifidobacterium porcinum]
MSTGACEDWLRFRSMISYSVRVIGPRGGRWTEFGAGPAGGLLGFCGFWCGRWLVSACWLALVWTRSVFGSRSRIRSVVWVLRTDGLTVVDCRSVRDSLESNGFVVLPWQTDQCRPVLVWTGSDSVL